MKPKPLSIAGQKGGSSTSAKKAAAARKNGKNGGRPKLKAAIVAKVKRQLKKP